MPSTAIEHMGYDEAIHELHVTFVGGGTYTYYQVPKQVYSAFRAAPLKRAVLQCMDQGPPHFRRRALGVTADGY